MAIILLTIISLGMSIISFGDDNRIVEDGNHIVEDGNFNIQGEGVGCSTSFVFMLSCKCVSSSQYLGGSVCDL